MSKIFITNQKKLVTIADCSQVLLTNIKKGNYPASEKLARKLNSITGIRTELFTHSMTKSSQLQDALDKFFREQIKEEAAAMERMARRYCEAA